MSDDPFGGISHRCTKVPRNVVDYIILEVKIRNQYIYCNHFAILFVIHYIYSVFLGFDLKDLNTHLNKAFSVVCMFCLLQFNTQKQKEMKSLNNYNYIVSFVLATQDYDKMMRVCVFFLFCFVFFIVSFYWKSEKMSFLHNMMSECSILCE